MKKTMTLLIAVLFAATSFAQSLNYIAPNGDVSQHPALEKTGKKLSKLPINVKEIATTKDRAIGDPTWLSYFANVSYTWKAPDKYNDNAFAMRFTPNYSCSLDSTYVMIYQTTGTPDMNVTVYDDNAGLPNTQLGQVVVPNADLKFYPNWTKIDLSSLNLTFNANEDFHIGFGPSSIIEGDTIIFLSDDGASATGRGSEDWNGTWGLMIDDWGVDVAFLFVAGVTYDPVTFTTDGTWAGTDSTVDVVVDGCAIDIPSAKADEKCRNLTIKPGGKLSVNGTLTVQEDVYIESDATGTGSLIDAGTLTVTGSSSIQLYQSATTTTPYWHYAAVPVDVSGGTITSDVFGTPYTPTATDYYAFYWDEVNQQYVSIEDNTTVLSEQMRGYAIPSDATNTLTFEGSVVTGTQSITPTYTGTATYSGFNLCGNPYPSGIDLATTSTMTGITNTNLDPSVWIREGGSFITYNWTSGDCVPVGAFDGVVPPMQAFWVKVTDGQASGTLEFTNDARIHDNDMVYKETGDNILRLSATLGERSDEMAVGFYKNASNSFDAYDSEKMFTDNNEFPQVYSVLNNKDLAINGLNSDFNNQVVVPLAYKVSTSGELTFNANNIDKFAPGISVYLKDNNENITIDLRKENTYSFTANAPANITNRFELIFGEQTTGINEASNDFNIYTSGHTVYLNCDKNQNAQVFVYDVTGRVIQNNKLSLVSGLNSFELNQTSNGIYFITVNLANRTVTEKVIIK